MVWNVLGKIFPWVLFGFRFFFVFWLNAFTMYIKKVLIKKKKENGFHNLRTEGTETYLAKCWRSTTFFSASKHSFNINSRVAHCSLPKVRWAHGFKTTMLVKFRWNPRLKQIFYSCYALTTNLFKLSLSALLLSFPNVEIRVYLQMGATWINIGEGVTRQVFLQMRRVL